MSGEPWTQEEIDAVTADYLAGRRVSDIADDTGRTCSGIKCQLLKLGIRRDGQTGVYASRERVELPRREWTEDDDDEAMSLFGRGESVAEIAVKLSRTHSSVQTRLHRLGAVNNNQPSGRVFVQKHRIRCLAPGEPHYFMSEDKRKNRICPNCKALPFWIGGY